MSYYVNPELLKIDDKAKFYSDIEEYLLNIGLDPTNPIPIEDICTNYLSTYSGQSTTWSHGNNFFKEHNSSFFVDKRNTYDSSRDAKYSAYCEINGYTAQEGNPPQFLLRGTIPYFNNKIMLDTPGTYILKKDSKGRWVLIGNTSITIEKIDDVSPTRMIAVLQGGGGAGCNASREMQIGGANISAHSNMQYSSGGGGGSGAFVVGVIPMKEGMIFTVGYGGLAEVNSSGVQYVESGNYFVAFAHDSANGAASKITLNDNIILSAGGGGSWM